jgi:3-hydroxy-9,10-secoandrosta-1,3,5(10)-triene-9,17-dione monooxygenase
VFNIVAAHPWQLALFPEETQEEVWGRDPSVTILSSYAPTGQAERVPGGFRVSGRWSFSTAATTATG